jgi:hypothetical protein
MGFRGEAQVLEHAVQSAEIDRAVLAILAAGPAPWLAGRPAAGLVERPAPRFVIFEISDHGNILAWVINTQL